MGKMFRRDGPNEGVHVQDERGLPHHYEIHHGLPGNPPLEPLLSKGPD
jgi:hypothetical protein